MLPEFANGVLRPGGWCRESGALRDSYKSVKGAVPARSTRPGIARAALPFTRVPWKECPMNRGS